MNENNEVHTQFFDSYTRALIDREAAAIAEHYAVPALIEFPGQRILITDAGQTHDFFAQAVGQYDGVTEVDTAVEVAASTAPTMTTSRCTSSPIPPATRSASSSDERGRLHR